MASRDEITEEGPKDDGRKLVLADIANFVSRAYAAGATDEQYVKADFSLGGQWLQKLSVIPGGKVRDENPKE